MLSRAGGMSWAAAAPRQMLRQPYPAPLHVPPRTMSLPCSQICYMRGLYDDSELQQSKIAGVGVHTLPAWSAGAHIPDGDMSRADQLVYLAAHIEQGVFEAIERRYLRSMMIAIQAPGAEPSQAPTLLESYIIHFQYSNDGKVNMLLQTSKSKPEVLLKYTYKVVRDKCAEILRLLNNTTRALPTLPAGCSLSIKLGYHANSTPADWHAPMFQPSSAETDAGLVFPDMPDSFDCGRTNTMHHSVALRVAAVAVERSDAESSCGSAAPASPPEVAPGSAASARRTDPALADKTALPPLAPRTPKASVQGSSGAPPAQRQLAEPDQQQERKQPPQVPIPFQMPASQLGLEVLGAVLQHQSCAVSRVRSACPQGHSTVTVKSALAELATLGWLRKSKSYAAPYQLAPPVQRLMKEDAKWAVRAARQCYDRATAGGAGAAASAGEQVQPGKLASPNAAVPAPTPRAKPYSSAEIRAAAKAIVYRASANQAGTAGGAPTPHNELTAFPPSAFKNRHRTYGGGAAAAATTTDAAGSSPGNTAPSGEAEKQAKPKAAAKPLRSIAAGRKRRRSTYSSQSKSASALDFDE